MSGFRPQKSIHRMVRTLFSGKTPHSQAAQTHTETGDFKVKTPLFLKKAHDKKVPFCSLSPFLLPQKNTPKTAKNWFYLDTKIPAYSRVFSRCFGIFVFIAFFDQKTGVSAAKRPSKNSEKQRKMTLFYLLKKKTRGWHLEQNTDHLFHPKTSRLCARKDKDIWD